MEIGLRDAAAQRHVSRLLSVIFFTMSIADRRDIVNLTGGGKQHANDVQVAMNAERLRTSWHRLAVLRGAETFRTVWA